MRIASRPVKPVVAVDANPATRAAVTGTEMVARELCARLPAAAPELDWRWYSSRPSAGFPHDLTVLPMRRLWSQLRLPVELRSRPPDLLFVPSHVVPFLWAGRSLTIVHDLAFERFPEAYSASARAYLRLTTWWAERRCPTLIAVSEATRADLAELHGVDPARVVVAHPGGGEVPAEPGSAPADRRRLAELGLDAPFALHVGRLEARKNQATALRAVEALPGLLLACAGAETDPGLAAQLRRSPRSRLLGRVSAADRDLLYRRAEMLVFPSLYEGFGFPVLEAMRHGLPVVTSRVASLPEVGGDAALYVDDPRDYFALSLQVRRLMEDARLKGALISAGRKQARLFTWDSFAATVAGVIRDLAGGPPAPPR